MGGCGSKADEVFFSDEEIIAIRDVWTRAKVLPIGRQILLVTILKKPKIGNFFALNGSLNTTDILENPRFQKEAERIHNFLDTVICSLGFCSLQDIYEMARQIGKNHYFKGIELDDELMGVFRKVTVEEILRIAEENREKQNERKDSLKPIEAGILGGTMLLKEVSNPYAALNCLARIGWDKLIGEICRNIRKGYEDQVDDCEPSIGQSNI